MISIGYLLVSTFLQRGEVFSILNLFTGGEQGVWYDPSDTAIFTRRNLLTWTDDFSVTNTWTIADASISTTDGGETWRLIESTTNSTHVVQTATTISVISPTVKSLEVKPLGRTFVTLRDTVASTAYSLVGSGSVVSGEGSITPLEDGWYRITSISSSVSQRFILSLMSNSTTTSYTGDGVSGIQIRKPQLEAGNTATTYQAITDVNQEIVDSNPNATLYQDDKTGVPTFVQNFTGIPNSSASQIVGLVLDKSSSLTRGPELFNDSDVLITSTGSTSAAVRVSPGYYRVERTATTNGSVQFVSTASGRVVSGRVYEVKATLYRYSGTNPEITLSRGTISSNFATLYNAPTGFFKPIRVTRIVRAFSSNFMISLPSSGTGVEIGNISVKEVLGNHAFQLTSASRPILGVQPLGIERKNLVLDSEEIVSSPWATTGSVTVVNGQLDPNGTFTAASLSFGTGTSNWRSQPASITLTAGQSITFSSWIRSDTPLSNVSFFLSGTDPIFNSSLGSFTVGSTWTRYSATYTASTNVTITGVGWRNTSMIYSVWGAQLELGSSMTSYQTVGSSALDVTQSGVPDSYYLLFDGSDDFLQTLTITPGLDKAQIFTGIRKLSDATTGSAMNASGSLDLYAPRTGANYSFESLGTSIGAAQSASSYPAPITNVLSAVGDVATDTAILRIDGAQVATGTTDQGTGNYVAGILYIGRHGGSSFPFNGRIYGLITRFGATLAESQISQTENWMANKIGFFAPQIQGVPTIS